jgi:penicillin amidase
MVRPVRCAPALALLSVGVVLGMALAIRTYVRAQGAPRALAPTHAAVAVDDDDDGVPRVRAKSYLDAIETQGFLVASERMFQLDLMRRAGAGRLAEWFGARALPLDRRRREEDWLGVARRAVDAASDEERALLEAYARGVNRFVVGRKNRWGVEYGVLRVEPEPWTAADSYLVLLNMAEELATSAPSDAVEGRWRHALAAHPAWVDLLFSREHPWNAPLFGRPAEVPWPEPALTRRALGDDEGFEVLGAGAATSTRGAGADAGLGDATARAEGTGLATGLAVAAALAGGASIDLAALDAARAATDGIGSNAWAYCGARGCTLANDPHLGLTVPQLWYPIRFEIDGEGWLVGASLPGLPGVVLGMNDGLAWGFTNVGEDVDDLVLETVSDDGARYVERFDASGAPEWAPVRVVTSTIVVRDAAPVVVRARWTSRGPVSGREGLVGQLARRWLPLVPGMLHFPPRLGRGRTIEAMNAALDAMSVPAQNVLMLERGGRIGYRASGTGIRRRAPGDIPRPAVDADWEGFEPPSLRPRLVLSATAAGPRWLVTANQRIWVDDGAHAWSDDARAERIRRALAEGGDALDVDAMARLQLDTESRFHRELLAWCAANAPPGTDDARAARWRAWRGEAAADPATFGEALVVERAIQSVLVGGVRALMRPGTASWAYSHRLSRGWLLRVLAAPEGLARFGVEPGPLAARMFAVAARAPAQPSYAAENAWGTQHPFVEAIPYVGRWIFGVEAAPQPGYRFLVRVEAPKFGASTRLLWRPDAPAESRWSFPVGQSGHVASPHYDDWRARWIAGQSAPVR